MIDDAEISRLRGEIDRVDEQLLGLLQARLELVLAVGDQKRARALEVYDPEREEKLLQKLGRRAEAPLDALLVERVFREVVAQCRRLEHEHVERKHT